MLTLQMSSECVHCVDFQWPKTTIPLSESVYRKSCVSYRYFYTTVLYIVYSDHVRTLTPNFALRFRQHCAQILSFFAPQRRHVAPMAVKFGVKEGTKGPLLRAKFHPHRCNDKAGGRQKLNIFYSDLTKMWNISAPQGRIPCAIFTKFIEFVPHFRML